MKKILFLLMLVFSMSYATVNSEQNTDEGLGTFNDSLPPEQKTKLKSPLLNLFQSTQWDLFMREFYIKLEFDVCCKPHDVLSCAIGVKAHMIEPIGYVESSHKPLYFPTADIDLGGNILKGGTPYQVTEGNSGARTQRVDNHFLYVPIMGMIFKKQLKFVCFHKGDFTIPYLSEFDPTWGMDHYYMKMVPHQILMFTPQGLLSTIFDCVATEIVGTMLGMQDGFNINNTGSNAELDSFLNATGNQPDLDSGESGITSGQSLSNDFTAAEANKPGEASESVMSKMNMIRDTMYYVVGCSGFSPIGGYVDGEDPIIDLDLTFHGIQSMLHGASALSPKPFLYKQTNISIESSALPKFAPQHGVPDTMCKWEDYMLPIQSQYLVQQAYPVVGSAKENGSSGASMSTAKNVPGAKGVVFIVWDRRDYYAFAYFCSEDENGDK